MGSNPTLSAYIFYEVSILDKINQEFKFLDDIKRTQIERLIKAGWAPKVAEEIWFKFRETYLRSWKEYVNEGLVSPPAGLKVIILGSVINKYLEKGK